MNRIIVVRTPHVTAVVWMAVAAAQFELGRLEEHSGHARTPHRRGRVRSNRPRVHATHRVVRRHDHARVAVRVGGSGASSAAASRMAAARRQSRK